MSLKSAYHAQHSLPNRSPTTRPRSLSLTDYQPLAFDREATQAAYQASLDFPASSVSSLSNHSTNSFSGHGSAETAATSAGLGTGTGTAMSSTSLSHYLKPGDNPHFPTRPASAGGLPPPPSNFAGIGAGHTLTPPQSPIHSAVSQVNLNRSSLLSPVPQSPLTPGMNAEPSPNFLSSEESMQATGRIPPTPESPFFPNMRMTRRASAMDVDGGEEYMGGPAGAQGSQGGGGKRRALPVVPTNVPTPEPPQWEPDYKPQIPPELVAASAQNAYASLSAPPPNLPPRRNPQRRASRGRTQSTSRMGNAQAGPSGRSYGDSSVAGGSGSSSQRTNPSRLVPPPLPSRMQSSTSNANGGSGMVVDPQPPQGNGGSLAQPPPGAPSFPPVNGIMPTQTRPKRTAPIEQGIILTAHDDKGIWSTHFVDPSLRKPIANMPPQLTNMTNTVLSGLASGPKTRFNTTTGAPIDGMAQLAKDWFVAPDAKFSSEQGGIELSLAIVDGSSEEEWGSDKGRKKARIDIGSKLGGIKVDLMEIEGNRQVDIKIETKSGDVLVLLPDNYLGPIHITSTTKPPEFLPILSAQIKPVVQPYENFYTTFVLPLALSRPAAPPSDFGNGNGMPGSQSQTLDGRNRKGKGKEQYKTSSIEHTALSKLAKYIPEGLMGQSDELDQAFGGIAAHTRGEQSKISVTAGKGRVVIGYRESLDEEKARGMGLKVGVKEGKGKKGWWR